MPLIMIGQNLQSKHSEARAESDYHINLIAENQIQELSDQIKNIEKQITDLNNYLQKTK